EDAIAPEPPPPPDDDWEEGELARVEQDRIEIRQPIRFAYGTDRIEADSLPILREVAEVLKTNPAIGQIIIEGHASAEGGFTYNYELSILRARAVWEALVDLGVHPLRMAYRGMGEVMPVSGVDDAGAPEAELARNRRVEFHIAHWRTADDPPLPAGTLPLPWSGEPRQFPAPPEPAPPAPADDPEGTEEAGP
ncbi:MAG: OmpA family protein, partial [Deltaproteobacteria bacterium]